MALTTCSKCGSRVSNQWPECPSCGTPTVGGPAPKKKRFNATPHYLAGTTLAVVGTVIYGTRFLHHSSDEPLMRAAIGMILVGICWYVAARVYKFIR